MLRITSVILLVSTIMFLSCSTSKSNGSGVTDNAGDPAIVLFIIVDDLNKELGVYGSSKVQTPNIDRLANLGMRFDRAYCNYSVCNPSRSSLLTGLRPETTTVLSNTIPIQSILGDRITLPALLKQNGYHTVNLGKIFHRPEAQHNDHKAWDEFHYFRATATGKKGKRRNLTGDVMKWCYWQAAEGDDEDQPDGQVAQRAIEILKREREQNLFLAVGLAKPHDPYIAPRKYFDLYPLDEIELPSVPDSWTEPFQQAFPLENSVFPQGKKIFNEFSDRDKREFLRSYYACISFMDAQLGKILDALEDTGQLESTNIFFFGDHGYHLGDHDWWNKFTLYEHSTGAPFIVAGPAVKQKGTKTDAMIEFIDIYPTLAELLNLKNTPDYLEGQSFHRILNKPEQDFRTFVQSVMTRVDGSMGKTVKNSQWRYIEWEDGKLGSELYDHHKDPLEYNNLVNDPEYASVVAEMKQLIH